VIERALIRELTKRGYFKTDEEMKKVGHTPNGGWIVLKRSSGGEIEPQFRQIEYASEEAAVKAYVRLKKKFPKMGLEIWLRAEIKEE
jgi:hypothetical protein